MAEIGPASVSRVVIVTVRAVSYHLCEKTLKKKNSNNNNKRFSVEQCVSVNKVMHVLVS